MSLLAIEGATPTASVALVDNGVIRGELFSQQGTGHAQILMGMVDRLLTMTETSREDLQVVGVTVGPGSFTGLRIGLATAQGLAMALSIPLVGISTLQVLAAPLAMVPALVVPVLNARKGEVYTAIYSGGIDGAQRLGDEMAIAPEALTASIKEALKATGHQMVILVGDGFVPYLDIWERELADVLLPVPAYHSRPRAGVLACLAEAGFRRGETVTALEIRPSYLRLSEAEVRIAQI